MICEREETFCLKKLTVVLGWEVFVEDVSPVLGLFPPSGPLPASSGLKPVETWTSWGRQADEGSRAVPQRLVEGALTWCGGS